MSEQICLFDIIDISKKSENTEPTSDFEGWDFDMLKAWASTLDYPWKEEPYLDTTALVCRRGRSDISLHLGKRVKCLEPLKQCDEWLDAVHFEWWHQPSQSGGGYASIKTENLKASIERAAERIGL